MRDLPAGRKPNPSWRHAGRVVRRLLDRVKRWGRVARYDGLCFEITHRCNKGCELCDHRIATSGYAGLGLEQYRELISRVGDRRSIRTVRLIGGEPLCHPDFDGMVRETRRSFPTAELIVETNGKLLPDLDPATYAQVHRFRLTAYPGWNDEVVACYGAREEVFVKQRILERGFVDPYRDPDLSVDAARQARQRCLASDPYLSFPVRVVGTRLYGCCMAEPIERSHRTPPLHVEFDSSWREQHARLPTWRACQHCYKVIDNFPDLLHH